jgi:hypothetical protein
MRWFAVTQTRAVESDGPVNYPYVDGRLKSTVPEGSMLMKQAFTPLDCVSGGVFCFDVMTTIAGNLHVFDTRQLKAFSLHN